MLGWGLVGCLVFEFLNLLVFEFVYIFGGVVGRLVL